MAEHEPKAGWYSRWTQKTVNGLPDWNAIRQRRDSVGQQLVNAGWGKAIEHARDEAERALRNKFIGTVEINQPDLITKVDIPRSIALNQPTAIQNWAHNSSFEIWPNQADLPLYWRMTGSGTPEVVSSGFIGARALSLSTGYGQDFVVYQDIEIDIPAGQTWTFSAWHTTDNALGLSAPATGFGLEITGYLVDNTTEVLTAAFTPDTGGIPIKVAVTGSFTLAVSKVRVSMRLARTPGFDFGSNVIVDLLQMEEGDVASPWQPHPLDNWPHVLIHNLLPPVWLESGDRAQFVEDMHDFWLRALPTRAEHLKIIVDDGPADSSPTAVGGLTSYGTAGRFIETDFFDHDWPYTVEAYSQGGTHSLRMVGTDVPDILGVFGLAFRNWRGWFEDDTGIEIEAITYFGGWLWVLHKADDFLGVRHRYLSAVDVKTPWPRPTYLEVPMTLELPTPSLGTTLTRLEFRHEDQQHIYIGDGLTTHVYTLHYDYFMIKGRVIRLREDPALVTITQAEHTRDELTTDRDLSEMERTVRGA
jgi:hypothetical protein